MKKFSQWWLFVTVAVVLWLLQDAVYVVKQGNRSLLFEFGQIRIADAAPGLHVKWPLIDTVQRFDGRSREMDSDTGEFLTSEKKNVHVGFFVEWRISDIGTYYRANGGQEQNAVDRLTAIVNHGLRDQFGSRTLRQIVDDEGHELTAAIKTAASAQAAELGIELIDVRIKNVALPDNVRDAVYERMRSERQRVAADTRAQGAETADKIRAEADQQAQLLLADAYRDAEKARGEGDAKASEIYAKAYGADPEFFRFYRSMSAYREVFHDKQDVLVLEPKGEFFRYLHDPVAKP